MAIWRFLDLADHRESTLFYIRSTVAKATCNIDLSTGRWRYISLCIYQGPEHTDSTLNQQRGYLASSSSLGHGFQAVSFFRNNDKDWQRMYGSTRATHQYATVWHWLSWKVHHRVQKELYIYNQLTPLFVFYADFECLITRTGSIDPVALHSLLSIQWTSHQNRSLTEVRIVWMSLWQRRWT